MGSSGRDPDIAKLRKIAKKKYQNVNRQICLRNFT